MSHSHAPGESCSHGHSHGQPQQAPQAQPDPAIQALIEQDFKPVNLSLTAESTQVVCGPHGLDKCTDCDVDFVGLNRLAKLLATNPTFLCPPPPNVVSKELSQAVIRSKDEGNVRDLSFDTSDISADEFHLHQTLYKHKRHTDAIKRYTTAASYAVQRPPWEASQIMREELSTVISNRSAAYYEAGDFLSAVVDADLVIQLRRNWSKGHFRKAKALTGLGCWEEAKEAVRLGLQFEPNNKVIPGLLQYSD
jgi:translocation protein SEC72